MNFGTFLPGKFLGSTLIVANMSECEQIIELSVDSSSYKYQKSQIIDQFPDVKKVTKEKLNENPSKSKDHIIPFCISKNDEKPSMVNSEVKYESWYIENPISKELTKRITLKLGPRAEQDFIIVIKSPQAKKHEDMMSMINIGLLTYGNE